MNRIKELREEKKLKQADLGALLAISRQAVSNYEIESRQLDPDTIRQLCAIFSCTSDYLLCLSDRREPDLTADEISLLAAWHAADDRAREMVQVALRPFMEKKETAAG